jgi:hypothetical protein
VLQITQTGAHDLVLQTTTAAPNMAQTPAGIAVPQR